MKIKVLAVVLSLLLGLSACSSTSLPNKGTVASRGMSVFVKPEKGFVGDPSPYFDGEYLNVYFIFDARGPGMFHPWHLYRTKDLVNWEYKGLAIPSATISEQDYGIGTGTVLKGKDELFHAFYTGWNGYTADIDFTEKVQHAVSEDLINWTKRPEDGFYGKYNDFRDPNVTYIPELDEYWMQVSTFYLSKPVLKFYKSKDLKNWTDAGVFYDKGKDGDFMECPTLIKYNEFWYLSYFQKATDGTNRRVTRYLYKKNITDAEWLTPPVEFLDGAGFSAGRLVNFNDRLLIVGWLGTKTADYDEGDFTWAGNLVLHEVKQNSDGTLYTLPIKEVAKSLATEVKYAESYVMPGVSVDKNTISFNGSKSYESMFFEKLESKTTKITFEISASSGTCGMVFDRMESSSLGNLNVKFDFDKNELHFYNKRPTVLNVESQAYVKFNKSDRYKFTILSENECMSIYINDEVALSTRMYEMAEKEFGFFSLGEAFKIENLHFYE